MTLFVLILTFFHFNLANLAWSSPADSDTTLSSKSSGTKSVLYHSEVGCVRNYIYRNRTFPVDSSRKLDGEGLRVVLKNHSPSESILNDYQSKIKSSYIPAYVSTLGIAALIGGPIYANSLKSPVGQQDTRLAFLISGIALAASGYVYGQYAIHAKEKTLEKAVQTYNDAVPELERIRVGLSPTSVGNGGEIKTQVPF